MIVKVYLTQEQVNNLPEGALVWIVWSGGNGPHQYTITHKYGAPFAIECEAFVDHVGEHPLTRVYL